MTETSVELTKRLSAAVEKMPAFPKSVQRILELSRDINCPPKELVMVIEKDPVTGLFVGYVPGWPGAHSQAETIETLQVKLREVVEMLLARADK